MNFDINMCVYMYCVKCRCRMAQLNTTSAGNFKTDNFLFQLKFTNFILFCAQGWFSLMRK